MNKVAMSCALHPYSTELSKPVPWEFVSFEHLFSKFLIATILNSVYFEPVRIGVDVMILCKEITHWVESSHNSYNHQTNNFGIRDLAS